MAKFSTGLRNGMLDTGACAALLDGGLLHIYAATTVPDTADAALPGDAVLLCTLSDNDTGDGLAFDSASDGSLPKAAAQIWKGTNLATGIGAFYRYSLPADTGAASATALRVQGTIGPVNADLLMGDPNFVSGQPFTLNYFFIVLPTL